MNAFICIVPFSHYFSEQPNTVFVRQIKRTSVAEARAVIYMQELTSQSLLLHKCYHSGSLIKR